MRKRQSIPGLSRRLHRAMAPRASLCDRAPACLPTGLRPRSRAPGLPLRRTTSGDRSRQARRGRTPYASRSARQRRSEGRDRDSLLVRRLAAAQTKSALVSTCATRSGESEMSTPPCNSQRPSRAMPASANSSLTVDEFLAWAEGRTPMEYGPLLRRETICTNMAANLHRRIPSLPTHPALRAASRRRGGGPATASRKSC